MEATIPEHLEESPNELSAAADEVPVENLTLASRHLAAIVRSMHAVGGRFASFAHRIVELQTEAHDLTVALAGLRRALRRAADFGTEEWFARAARKINPRTTKVTTGLVFDSAGNHLKTVESGRDELSRFAQDALTGVATEDRRSVWQAAGGRGHQQG